MYKALNNFWRIGEVCETRALRLRFCGSLDGVRHVFSVATVVALA
jgi:hypothetical protein